MHVFNLDVEQEVYIMWTKEEIVRNFTFAKNKEKQVEILADLTQTDIDTILQILEEAGAFEPKKRVCAWCYRTYNTIHVQGKAVCPECRKTTQKIIELKRELKYITARIQQLGMDSAKIRSEINRLEAKRNDKN